jgi:hypothetical protein
MTLIRSKPKRKDKRAKLRKTISQGAEISDVNMKVRLQCIIKDATQDGCQILCTDIDEIPDHFLLTPTGHDFTVRGTIIWRAPHRAGVEVDWASAILE